MKCLDVQKHVLANVDNARPGEPSSRIQRHLDRCNECADFAKTVDTLVPRRGMAEPAAELDARVLDLAAKRQPTRRRSSETSFRVVFSRRTLVRWTVAACVVFAAILAVLHRSPSQPSLESAARGETQDVGSEQAVDLLTDEFDDLETELLALELAFATALPSGGDRSGATSSDSVPPADPEQTYLDLEAALMYMEEAI